MYICPVKAPLAPAPWNYRNSSWKSRQQESGLNENSQAHVLHCSHTINAEKWRTWHCRTALDSCRVYTRVGDLASTALLEWVYVHCSAVMNEADRIILNSKLIKITVTFTRKKWHSLQCLLLSFKVKCTLSTTNQPWKHGVLVHRRGFLISLQLSEFSAQAAVCTVVLRAIRPWSSNRAPVDRRHRFSLPGHVHIHFRQTLGQVTIAVHLGEPGGPRTTGLYWTWWTGPD